jgi:hypothetical protein
MTYSCLTEHQLLRDDLQRFIAVLPGNRELNLHDWLQTLETQQLRKIQEDATLCCVDAGDAAAEISALNDLTDIASMAYSAERRCSDSTDEVDDGIEELLIGLAVATCLERLKRVGWVNITGRVRIVLGDPRPYHVTHRGVKEGAWSEEPMILWILGFQLGLH